MTTKYKHYLLQLKDEKSERAMYDGGEVKVTTVDTYTKVALYSDMDGTAATVVNGTMTFTSGKIEFWTLNTVSAVDIYGLTDSGDAFVCKNFKGGQQAESVIIDAQALTSMLMIPVDTTSSGDNFTTTEADLGFDLPAGVGVDPNGGIGAYVGTIKTSATFDLGILSSKSGGDADGFLNDLSVDVAGYIVGKASSTAGTIRYYASTTLGALIAEFAAGGDQTGRIGINNLKIHVGNGTATSFSITMSAGNTAKFLLLIPLIKGGTAV